jgi:hypothetical protein
MSEFVATAIEMLVRQTDPELARLIEELMRYDTSSLEVARSIQIEAVEHLGRHPRLRRLYDYRDRLPRSGKGSRTKMRRVQGLIERMKEPLQREQRLLSLVMTAWFVSCCRGGSPESAEPGNILDHARNILQREALRAKEEERQSIVEGIAEIRVRLEQPGVEPIITEVLTDVLAKLEAKLKALNVGS